MNTPFYGTVMPDGNRNNVDAQSKALKKQLLFIIYLPQYILEKINKFLRVYNSHKQFIRIIDFLIFYVKIYLESKDASFTFKTDYN